MSKSPGQLPVDPAVDANQNLVRLGEAPPPISDMWGTPYALADACVQTLLADGVCGIHHTFMEPSAGNGEWLQALLANGCSRAIGIDIEPRDPRIIQDNALHAQWTTDVTIGNPPFSLWIEFVEHSKRQSPIVAFLLKSQVVTEVRTRCPHRLISGTLRDGLRIEYKLPRIKFIPLAGQPAGNGDSMAVSLFVWDRDYRGECRVSYNVANRLLGGER